MRVRSVVLLVPLLSACTLDPVEIGRAPPVDPIPGEFTSGSFGMTWTSAALSVGVSEVVSLGTFDGEIVTLPDGQVRRVAIELMPVTIGPLPAELMATVYTVDDQPAAPFEPSGEGLRFEAELELGWRLELHSDESVDLLVTARFID